MPLNILQKTIIGTILCFITSGLSAQFVYIPSGYHDYYFQPKNMGISTPQVADFQRYGNLPVDHYNGLLNMEIPLDGYKDKDFDLPMSIRYVSQGFIPSKRPSIVGVNWFLNFGGVITRTVKGSPDDTKGNYVSDKRKYIKDGLLVAMRNGTYVQHSESTLTNFTMPMNSSYHVNGDLKHDFEPDIFHFNFGKHQGRFIIGKDGSPICLSGNGYKIDISGLSVQSYSTTAAPATSTIKITTPDGYVYQFGGNITYLEYVIPNNPGQAAVSPRYILSWHLKSIKSPNNREVVFTYDSRLLPNHYNYYLYSENETGSTSSTGQGSVFREENPSKVEIKDKVYSPVINKVVIDDLEIRFPTGSTTQFFDADDPSYYLSAVLIYYNSLLIKRTSFKYETNGKYGFLTTLTKNDEIYKFEYYSITPPSPLTVSVDHWGFWNGLYDTNISNIKDYCLNIEANRASSPNVNDVGLLRRVIYPTGGRTDIIYEKNTYNRYQTKDTSGNLSLNTLSSGEYCGGSRVRSIIDYDPVMGKSYNVRNFEYKTPGNNVGSGIIYLKPEYTTSETFAYTANGSSGSFFVLNYIKDISSNSLGFRENYPEYHVCYSDVIERFSDRSYIHHEYTSHADIANLVTGFTYKIVDEFPPLNQLSYSVLKKVGLFITNDLSHFRGKLKRQRNYKSAGNLDQTIEYFYNNASAGSSYNTSVASAYRGFSSYRIYTTPCLLTSKKITDVNNIVYTENYSYNSRYFVSKREVVNSDGVNYAMNYKYPIDYTYSSLAAAAKSMVDKNILDKPLRIFKTTQESSGTAMATDAIVFEYKTDNNLQVLDNIKELYVSAPVLETSTTFTNNLITREKYMKYDSYGNPIHILKDDLYNIVYLWGYKGKYPVAEVVNANYDEVKAALGGIAPESLSSASTPDTIRIQALRNALPQANIMTYTHSPLFGITSIVEPNSLRNTYEYNDHGRLINIYNYQQIPVKTFAYNFSEKHQEPSIIIRFTNTQTSLNTMTGINTMTAIIECPQTMTITLEHGLAITGNAISTSAGYTIGSNNSVTLNSSTQTDRTYTLYAGENRVYISVYKGSASMIHAWLKIKSVSMGQILTPPNNSLDLRY